VSLSVSSGVYSESAFSPHWNVLDRDEVNTLRLSAVHAEVLDLPEIVALQELGVWMVCIRAASAKSNGATFQSACLALDAREPVPLVDHDVVSRVLAKRDEERIARVVEAEHDRELGRVADCLWVLHGQELA
jgi:hypothetical protein